MSASSVTGTGPGSARMPDGKDLSLLANGPSIVFAGAVETELIEMTSPPTYGGTVTYPFTLSGSSSDYVVILTGLNTNDTYLTEVTTSDFTFLTYNEGEVMYLVVAKGIRPTINPD